MLKRLGKGYLGLALSARIVGYEVLNKNLGILLNHFDTIDNKP